MHVVARMFTGGLAGFAILLAMMGHPAWGAHALAAGISLLANILARKTSWWDVVSYLAVVVVYFTQWFV